MGKGVVANAPLSPDMLNAELPRSIAFLVRVRAGIIDADMPNRISAAKFLIEHAPAFMRVVAEIEREKNTPAPSADPPKAYVITNYQAPNQPVRTGEDEG